ncbi:MAG: isocitrate lyase/phosphoenolpyruvate mutase family protein, partial [Acidimicrobiales bacterium]
VGAGGGSLDLDGLRAIGVRRVSTGGALPRALYALLADAGRQMLEDGSFAYTERVIPEEEINDLMD